MTATNHRRLGRSGRKVSEASFRSWVTYGNRMNEGLARECMAAARAAAVQRLPPRARRRRIPVDVDLGTTRRRPLAIEPARPKVQRRRARGLARRDQRFDWLAARILEPSPFAKVQSLVPIAQESGCTLARCRSHGA
jgi:hypothetical protein